MYYAYYSPRARRVLFMFLSPKGSMVVSYAKNSQESKNVTLTNVNVELTSQYQVKDGNYRDVFFLYKFTREIPNFASP